ncbi:MAG: helix-turn-helix domain-containing protein [Clostridiales bacterium]|jgi:hypothetical protein|nr:helix-turn-helix domain-containing protein [Clostridiales bacterium]
MMPDYEKLLDGYPEYVSKEQMRLICHISKKTARLLLQKGLVPCAISDRKTHTYKIAKSDIIDYLNRREAAPEKYILPEGSYAHTPDMSDADYSAVVTADFSLFEEYLDVLSVRQAAVLSGVGINAINTWARKKRLKAFIKNGAYYIPKLSLIEYLQSPLHKRNYIWKLNNLAKRAARKDEAPLPADFENQDFRLPEDDIAPDPEPSGHSGGTISAEVSPFDEYPDLLSVQQAAALAEVEPDTIKVWLEDKRLKAFVKKRVCHIPKQTLIEYLNSLPIQA